MSGIFVTLVHELIQMQTSYMFGNLGRAAVRVYNIPQ